MPSPLPLRTPLSRMVAVAAALGAGIDAPRAQQLTRPVYRVAELSPSPAGETATAPISETAALDETAIDRPLLDEAVEPASAQLEGAPFDLAQRPGEHPLMACLRLAQGALVDMDQRVHDYQCTFTKVERLDGKLGDPQKIQMRVRHQPFSVYMKFITPNPGQEVLYVAGKNDGKLVALASGWKRRIGKVNLPVDGMMAMQGQRYPITKAGIRNLTAELVEIAQQDVKYAECDVEYGVAKIDGRPVTMIRATHPTARKNFRFHKAEIFIDNELRLPVAYQAFSWPAPGTTEPILEEKYIYTDLVLNNGFTDADFSADNPAMFR